MRIYDSRRNSELLTKVEEGKREVRRDGWERRGKARRKGEWEGAEEGRGRRKWLAQNYFSSSWSSTHARPPEVFEDSPSPTQVLTRSS